METDGEARSGEGAAAKDRKSRLEKLQIKESDIAPRSLGKEDETRTQKPFIGTLRVTNPARQSLASSRKRVLRGGGATLPAKRRQPVPRPCD